MVIIRGEEVEVRSNQRGFKDAWFKAEVLRTRRGKKGYAEVRYLAFHDESGEKQLVENVSYSLIRPLPLLDSVDGDEKQFEEQDVVDAYHDLGWWKGVVSKVRVLEDNSKIYAVVFNHFTSPEENEYQPSSLRHHMDWVDGQWVQPSKAQECLTFSIGMAVEVHIDRGKYGWIPAVVTEEVGFTYFKVRCTDRDKRGRMEVIVDSLHIRPPSSTGAGNGEESTEDETPSQPSVMISSMPPPVNCHQKYMWLKAKQRKPHKKAKTTAIVGTECAGMREVPETPTPLVHGGDSEGINPSCAVEAPATSEPVEHPMLPFVKVLFSLWEPLESLSVFKDLPQRPHFHPLYEFKENEREGLAIGLMVLFQKLANEILELRVCDRQEIFGHLDSLAKLEKHGFDTEPLARRLNRMLSVNDKRCKFQDELKKIQTQIVECSQRKAKLEEDIHDEEERMRKLQEEHEETMRKLKEEHIQKSDELTALVSEEVVIIGDISNADEELDNITTEGW